MIVEGLDDALVVVLVAERQELEQQLLLEEKWCSSPGSLTPTSLAIVASEAPRKPRVAKTSLAAARIASRRSRPFA